MLGAFWEILGASFGDLVVILGSFGRDLGGS